MKSTSILSALLIVGCTQPGVEVDFSPAPDTSPTGDPRPYAMNQRRASSKKATIQLASQEEVIDSETPLWEYRVLSFAGDLAAMSATDSARTPASAYSQSIENNLNHFGSQGWELVYISDDLVILKRPRPGW